MSRIILMGPPGVGKGTQARLLSESLSVPAVSTGDIFRREISERTPLGVRLKALIERGEYVPDEVTTAVLAARLNVDDAAEGFILDGYPRTIAQVDDLDQILASTAKSVQAVLLLKANRDTLVTRLGRRAEVDGRPDDTPDVIERRLAIYERETADIVRVYADRGLVSQVDGEASPDVVAARLRSAIDRR